MRSATISCRARLGVILPLALAAAACSPVGGLLRGADSGAPNGLDSGRDSDTVDPGDSADGTERLGDPMQVIFSVDRGFYDAPFELQIYTERPDTTLHWTLDGSDPRSSHSVFSAANPASLTVDPASDEGRDIAPGVVLRAYATREAGSPSLVATASYLFPQQVCALSPHDEPPGPAWPEPYYTDYYLDEDQSIDYGMDPRVCDDPAYADLMVDALTDIPSISIVTELAHLFDAETGIYMNAMEHGLEWERPCSLELLDPADEAELQEDAGLRIRGGWSRWNSNPKHAFRLFFRSDYGAAKLEFPLFDDEGAQEFDGFDLRTSQNYSWSFKSDTGRENTMNRDVFSRDAQRDLGQPYSRSRYYHLYLNGVYWGLYQSQERPEASFAETYLGGDKDDYDVVKVQGEDPTARVIEATDGDLEAWEAIWERVLQGFETDEKYQALLGNDPTGEPDPELPTLVDADNLIDYMLVIFWTGNFDAPTGSFTYNQEPNNFFAIHDREDAGEGFVFFAHDSEHSLLADSYSPGQGLAEDRVNLGTRGDSYQMGVADFIYFHPQWLHFKLTDHPDYRARFAARAAEVLQGDGPLTPENAAASFHARAEEIELAIIAESARWGDAKDFEQDGRSWRTRDDDWVPAVQRVLDLWCPARTGIVIAQLQEAGLW